MSRPVVTVVIAMLCAGASAQAQRAGAIAGVILAPDSTPVPFARVSLAGSTTVATSGADGRFHMENAPAGRQELNVRKLGFVPQTFAVRVRGGDTLALRVQLTRLAPVELQAVEVSAPVHPMLRGFETRRALGIGTFLRQEEIFKSQPRNVTDVLRRVPGLQIRPLPGPYGTNLSVVQRGSRCPVMFFLNGSPFPILETPITNFVNVDELVAVEVYNPSELPSQFNSSAGASRCGMVGLWTQYGRTARKNR